MNDKIKSRCFILLEKRKVFALDIGTRSVVGVILEQQDEQYHVIDIHIKEHSERAMIDGQIHDVLSVAKTVKEIKETLEKKHGPLKKVCVAAAGRALKTERAAVSVNINGKPMIKKEDILHLELQAVQQAQANAAKKNNLDKTHYYCVGYSILYYRLDGEEIGSLIDQQGDEVSVEIIATFLPKVVVESLIAAIQRAGLQMGALTLEPIAAINVLIPPSMRRLNVALVDIGAGTSDIAITDMGTITAYGMVPIAGDEITETISDQFLLDFPLAEQAKRQIHANELITVQDILGFETEIPKQQMIHDIEPAIDRLATEICKEILSLNKDQSPKAIMLVGGGSMTPELPKKIADKLQLPENRVALRGIDAIAKLTFADHLAKGPELVTPIGIAITAQRSPVHYKTVYVNEQPIRLFEVNKLTVSDCLLAAGIKTKELFGKPGMAKIVTVNGKAITLPGKHGELPILEKNNERCSLDDDISDGDHITVKKGQDGKSPIVHIKDLIDQEEKKLVYINDQVYEISPTITCNGEIASIDQQVEDRDVIVYHMPDTIKKLLEYVHQSKLLYQLKPFQLFVNNKKITLPQLSGKIIKNGLEVNQTSRFEHLDKINIVEAQSITVKEFAEMKEVPLIKSITVTFNGEQVTLTKEATTIYRNDRILTADDSLFTGDHLTMKQPQIEPFIFQDLFKYVDIKLPEHTTGKFTLLKNDKEITFYDPIIHGDKCEIVWPLAEDKVTIARK